MILLRQMCWYIFINTQQPGNLKAVMGLRSRVCLLVVSVINTKLSGERLVDAELVDGSSYYFYG